MTAVAVGALVPARPRAQETSPLAGVWTLNRSLSEFPSDIGFNMSWAPTPGGDGRSAGSNAGGRGRRGSAGGGGNRGAAAPLPARPESYDDAQRAQLLTAEVRNPPVRLIVVNTPTAVIITNELGQSRTLHPDGKEESIEIQGMPIRVTSKRDGDRLVALYRVDQDRQMSYTYSYSASPSRLVIDVQFLEHGAAGDKARRVYEPGVGAETVPSVSAAAAPAPATSRPPAPETLDKRPGADLRGLKSLGIVVEDLSAQAAVCGLSRDAIESKLSKQLTDGGFVVRKNSDEDTYVYVNVITTSLSNSLCVSRYDAFLYTSATAKLSYHDQPVLVQVSLMHRGGISGSAPTDHGAAVARGLENVIDLFVTQIHDANK
jgi:hypothetical protein